MRRAFSSRTRTFMLENLIARFDHRLTQCRLWIYMSPGFYLNVLSILTPGSSLSLVTFSTLYGVHGRVLANSTLYMTPLYSIPSYECPGLLGCLAWFTLLAVCSPFPCSRIAHHSLESLLMDIWLPHARIHWYWSYLQFKTSTCPSVQTRRTLYTALSGIGLVVGLCQFTFPWLHQRFTKSADLSIRDYALMSEKITCRGIDLERPYSQKSESHAWNQSPMVCCWTEARYNSHPRLMFFELKPLQKPRKYMKIFLKYGRAALRISSNEELFT